MWRTHIEREIDDLASYPAVQLCTFAVLSGLTDWKVAKVRGNGLVLFLLFFFIILSTVYTLLLYGWSILRFQTQSWLIVSFSFLRHAMLTYSKLHSPISTMKVGL
jgi:hypothetical protein